ncbi:MAG TPA: hypothetical protein VMW21_01345 [Patescibacteria group bacterium]|nr:hypothetical protein [Patescibacteria group bacterium]
MSGIMRKSVLVAIFVLMIANPAAVMASSKFVPITKLGVAPWLGEIRDENDLATKFAKEDRQDFIRYIRFDLKEAVNLDISADEAEEILSLVEEAIKEERVKKITLSDGAIFHSMGWRSRATKKIMRTPDPILKLGRPTEGFLVRIQTEEYRIEYVFLQECGNLCLCTVKSIRPAGAQDVPAPEKEPAQKKETEKEEARVVEIHYVYILPPSTPAYFYPQQPMMSYGGRRPYYGGRRPYYGYSSYSSYNYYDYNYSVRAPVRTSNVRPPSVRTVSPAASSVRASSVRTSAPRVRSR